VQPTLSEQVAAVWGTVADEASEPTSMSTGQEMAGAPVSFTVIVNEQDGLVLPAVPSVAVYVTDVEVPVEYDAVSEVWEDTEQW
jgi:hypothetical protein